MFQEIIIIAVFLSFNKATSARILNIGLSFNLICMAVETEVLYIVKNLERIFEDL